MCVHRKHILFICADECEPSESVCSGCLNILDEEECISALGQDWHLDCFRYLNCSLTIITSSNCTFGKRYLCFCDNFKLYWLLLISCYSHKIYFTILDVLHVIFHYPIGTLRKTDYCFVKMIIGRDTVKHVSNVVRYVFAAYVINKSISHEIVNFEYGFLVSMFKCLKER